MKLLPLLLCVAPVCAFAASEDCATRLVAPTDEMSLSEVIDMGLCRNPQTASAFLAAQSARYAKNAGYASYLPSVTASASGTLPYKDSEFTDWAWGASLSASYLLFDFGKRLADLNKLTATWRAAGFEYDETVQNYIYSIIGAYYELLNANADVASAEALLTVAQTAKSTADKKYSAGSVAKVDVLQAATTLASRDLDLRRAKNEREIAKGTLLSKLSFPANQDVKIADMSAEFGSAPEIQNISELLEMAQRQRPDLLAAAADSDAAWHSRNSTLLSNLPSISASASVSWDSDPSNTYDIGSETISGSIGIRASMPIFAGFANLYAARSAETSYQRSLETQRYAQDNASLDVFSAYQNYRTAQTVLTQTKTLLASASETEQVTSGMYKVGRATMLDWQTAQSELVDAEKQHNAAKYDLFTKRAAVALAVGEVRLKIAEEKQGEQTNEE